MNPLNELEAKLSAEVAVAVGWVKSLLWPALYIFGGTCFGAALTLIVRH